MLRIDVTVHRLIRLGLSAAALTAGLGLAPAAAQDADQTAAGPVVEFAAGQATVATPTGPVTVQFSPETRFEMDSAGTLADVQPGQVVGVTGRPEGTGLAAVEIHVFPSLLNVRQAQTPMSGANAGNSMTNARVASFTDGVLTLNLADQLIPINTSAATAVTHPVPAAVENVQAAGRLAASGPVGADGVLQARVVWIPAARQ